MSARKNIILITVDDGNAYARYRSAFGQELQVPNLDRIEAESVSFQSAYCQAPICGPSRNSMLSGFGPHQTGIIDNYTLMFETLRPEQLWQHRLKQNGYYCSTAGKVHHRFQPLDRVEHNALYSHSPKPLKLGPPRNADVKRYGGYTGGAGTTDPADDALYYDHQSADDAVAFLENYDGDAPFYREIGFHHPHIPLKTPAAYKDMYDEQAFVPPEEWAEGFELSRYPERYMVENMDMRDADYWRKSVRNYFSAYSHVDTYIGKVWDALKASKHADNTILIFTSDHGYHLGDKGRMRKFTLWEESACVPLMIYDPDVKPRAVKEPVGLIDIGPTILDYANSGEINGSPGVSLRSSMEGNVDPERAVPTFLYGNSSMRKGRYRITLYQSGESEFHDVQADPWLNKNLGTSHPDYDSWRAELSKVCLEYGMVLPDVDTVAAPYQASFIGSNTPHALGHYGAIGNLDDQRQDCTPVIPGFRVHYTTLDKSGTAPLPTGFRRMHYGADNGGGAEKMEIFGNADSNEIIFPGSLNRFEMTVHPGPKENLVAVQLDDLIVYSGEGSCEVRIGGANSAIYGGSGELTVRNRAGRAFIQGGSGDLSMLENSGPSKVVSGRANNRILASSEESHITLCDGQSTVALSGDAVTLVLRRTGLPQIIHGFVGGRIELDDWAEMGSAQLRTDGKDTLLICGTEQIRFKGADLDHVRDAIEGIEIASEGRVG